MASENPFSYFSFSLFTWAISSPTHHSSIFRTFLKIFFWIFSSFFKIVRIKQVTSFMIIFHFHLNSFSSGFELKHLLFSLLKQKAFSLCRLDFETCFVFSFSKFSFGLLIGKTFSDFIHFTRNQLITSKIKRDPAS